MGRVGDTYSIAQHVDDIIGFIEKLHGPVDLMVIPAAGIFHSRCAAPGRSVAKADPGRARRRTSTPRSTQITSTRPSPPPRPGLPRPAKVIAEGRCRRRAGDIHRCAEAGRLEKRLPATPSNYCGTTPHADRADARTARPALLKSMPEAIKTPTLFYPAAPYTGTLPHALTGRERCGVGAPQMIRARRIDVRTARRKILRIRGSHPSQRRERLQSSRFIRVFLTRTGIPSLENALALISGEYPAPSNRRRGLACKSGDAFHKRFRRPVARHGLSSAALKA